MDTIKRLALVTKQHRRQLFATFNRKSNPTYIYGGTIVNAEHKFKGNVLTIDGKIVSIDTSNRTDLPSNTTKIDATGKLVIPGGIDPHVHLELPFMGTTSIDDFNVGTQAALAGGTTCFMDFIIPDEKGLIAGFDDWKARADKRSNSDYALHCAITDWNPKISQEMEDIVKRGVQSFKVFMAYKGSNFYQNDDRLLQIFQRCKELGTICLVHAENGELVEFNQNRLVKKGCMGPESHLWSRDGDVEAQAVHTAITIGAAVNTPLYIVHVMKRAAAEEIIRAKRKGYVVYAEALAAGLGVDGRHYFDKDWDKAASYVMSPVIDANPDTKEFEMKLLQTHDLDTVATDNCTFSKAQKSRGHECFKNIPNGCNGIEDRMSVVWNNGVETGMISPMDFVRVTSTNAAKIFNMYPRKGVVAVGSDADLVVWDPQSTRIISAKTHHHAGDTNIFEGMKVRGAATSTLAGGRLVWHEGKLNCEQGTGEYIARPNDGYPFERIHILDNQRNLKETPVKRGKEAVVEEENMKERLARLETEAQVAQQQIDQLNIQLKTAKENTAQTSNDNRNGNKVWSEKFQGEITGLEDVLQSYLPEKEHEEIRRILYGNKADEIQVPKEALEIAKKFDFEIKSYKISAKNEELRAPRIVRIGAVQHAIKAPTTAPVVEQRNAIFSWIREVAKAAYLSGVNVLCLQELFHAPFFPCTREKYPWVEFAENYKTGPTALLTQELAKKYNMVIVASILERDEVKGTIHNTAVVTNNTGDIMGRHHKIHIPRVGDFNESTYYMEGNLGHAVFETGFGKIGVNVCYSRHHPLSWMMYGINGAEIVVNPSATVGSLSEPMWGIEARCAAIANHYYVVGINRVGTETYKNAFTSGDGKLARHDFGMFYGSSYVAAPDASRTPGLSRTKDGLLVTEIDLNQCAQVKDTWGFTMTGRFELYAQELQKAIKEDFAPLRVKL